MNLQYQVRFDGITAVRWVVASSGVLVRPPGALLVFEREEDGADFGLDTEVHD